MFGSKHGARLAAGIALSLPVPVIDRADHVDRVGLTKLEFQFVAPIRPWVTNFRSFLGGSRRQQY